MTSDQANETEDESNSDHELPYMELMEWLVLLLTIIVLLSHLL